ncbi:hypothetical protein Fmac_005493 [Flemingia macrophylla]|uniref:Uncharacterized protein n=1 Tax=Flemingia macrophylla TaxID=520843 RepID=A0ABD1N997_9FABA
MSGNMWKKNHPSIRTNIHVDVINFLSNSKDLTYSGFTLLISSTELLQKNPLLTPKPLPCYFFWNTPRLSFSCAL